MAAAPRPHRAAHQAARRRSAHRRPCSARVADDLGQHELYRLIPARIDRSRLPAQHPRVDEARLAACRQPIAHRSTVRSPTPSSAARPGSGPPAVCRARSCGRGSPAVTALHARTESAQHLPHVPGTLAHRCPLGTGQPVPGHRKGRLPGPLPTAHPAARLPPPACRASRPRTRLSCSCAPRPGRRRVPRPRPDLRYKMAAGAPGASASARPLIGFPASRSRTGVSADKVGSGPRATPCPQQVQHHRPDQDLRRPRRSACSIAPADTCPAAASSTAWIRPALTMPTAVARQEPGRWPAAADPSPTTPRKP